MEKEKIKRRGGIFFMVNKATRFLNNTLNQEKLFNSIEEDVRKIIEPYNFEKVIFVRQDVGEITIELQDPIPTKLIKEMDDYFELEGVLEKSHYHINLIYNIK